jgi:poly-beta-1,6-N-acetyl-D-glucosamine synthase
MKWLFWISAAMIAYTYFGYPAWLWGRSRWRSRPVRRAPCTPFVSVVMVIRNEANVLERKLRNLMELDYPPDLCEIVVVSDGSSDGTESILRQYVSNPYIHVVLNQLSRGKASGLNDALNLTRGEVVVFTDARQKIEPDAVRLLMENFADPSVGCASGELMLGDRDCGEPARGLGLYWRIEKKVRELESRTGSVVGATGALYAARRNLLEALQPETILDDVYIPMRVVQQGFRVVFDPRARVWDVADLGTEREFARKVRTLGGKYQLLQLCPWLLSRQNPVRFEFVSHKLLRLVVPFALAAALVSAAVLHDPVYRVALAGQVAFYGLGLLSVAQLKRGLLGRVADAAFTFEVLNTAALVAFVNFVTGRKAAWGR